MEKFVVILSLAAVLVLILTAAGIVSTEKQVSKYVGLPVYVGAVPEQIREALLEKLPRGSAMADVRRFLVQQGIGATADSGCTAEESVLICKLGLDPSFWKLLRERYNIFFDFDRDKRLRDVHVDCRYRAAWANVRDDFGSNAKFP